MTRGPDFYDDADIFARYMQRRERADNPNDTIERPVFMELLGDVRDKAILDLGCGDGRSGVELLAAGCQSYTGVEASQRMFALAHEHLNPVGGTVHQALIEDWNYPQLTFDLVISRLAFHYVDDIVTVLSRIHGALRAGGRLIFSVEHPVLTSDNSAAASSSVRLSWTVDEYFVMGRRDVQWMGGQVTMFHRTIEAYFRALQQTNFLIEQLREPGPQHEYIQDEKLYARRQRIPLFLMFAAQRRDEQH